MSFPTYISRVQCHLNALYSRFDVLLVMESSPRRPLIPSISLRISPSPSSWSFPVILLHEPPNHAMDGWLEAGSTIFTKQKRHLLVVNVVTHAYTDKRNTRTAESVSAKASTKPRKAHPLLPRGIWSPGFKSRAGLFRQVYSLRL